MLSIENNFEWPLLWNYGSLHGASVVLELLSKVNVFYLVRKSQLPSQCLQDRKGAHYFATEMVSWVGSFPLCLFQRSTTDFAFGLTKPCPVLAYSSASLVNDLADRNFLLLLLSMSRVLLHLVESGCPSDQRSG